MSLALRSRQKCVLCALRAAEGPLLSLTSKHPWSRYSTAASPDNHAREPFRKDSLEENGKGSRRVILQNRDQKFLRSAAYSNRRMEKTREGKEQLWSKPHAVLNHAHVTYEALVKDLNYNFFVKKTKQGVPRVREIAGISDPGEFMEAADDFWKKIAGSFVEAMKEETRPGTSKHSTHPAALELAARYAENDRIYSEIMKAATASESLVPGNPLRLKLKSMLIDHIHSLQMPVKELAYSRALGPDLRYPIEWYPAARALQRKIHLHVGPTNSGKTYHALKRLEQAESGIYAGPLRLLAHEVYSRLNAAGKNCALITGEERRIPEGHRGQMSSCTVEMVPLSLSVEVAVIDEIQMMADGSRGWAWTQAFLGVQAKEVHLCGELRTIELVQKLCKLTGDELIIHKYDRLTPLETMGKSFGGKLSKLEKGDAVILFSRVGIHAMKKEIERNTGKRCAVIYGSLPPETRAQQAALFNDQTNDYDFLVASDAVGMGLNLGIRRVIFESTVKYDGKGTYKQLSVSEIKQIAGRAGRYKTATEGIQDSKNEGTREDGTARHPKRNVGLATTLDPNDHMVLKIAMETDVEPIKACGVFPPMWAYKKFSAYFPPGTPFTHIMSRAAELATLSPMFFICRQDEQYRVADAIEHLDLPLEDRMIFMASPADMRHSPDILIAFAAYVAAQKSAELCDIKVLPLELLDVEVPGRTYLQDIEKLHNALTLYLWLSYRFAGVFVSQPLAFHVKGLVEIKIDEELAKVAISNDELSRRRKFRHRKAEEERQNAERLTGEIEERAAADAPTPYSSAIEDEQEPLMDPIEASMIGRESGADSCDEGPLTLQTEQEDVEEAEDEFDMDDIIESQLEKDEKSS